jgi:hypothetical protein
MISGPEPEISDTTQMANARCGTCNFVWPVVQLPMELERAARLMKQARCPRGCDDKVYLA